MQEVKFLPHQEAAIERLEQSSGRQLLNLCPGAGKTLTTLAYLAKHSIQNALIIVPASLLGTWSAEARKWGLPELVEFKGVGKERDIIYQALIDNISSVHLVIGYEMFLKEWSRLSKRKWDVLVCDESQKLKSPTAKISKVVRKFAQTVDSCILLSGTPLVNSWMDMWNQVETIKPGALYGRWTAFRAIHAIMPVPNIPMIKGWRNVETIKEKLKPYVFTIPKEAVQNNLPPVSVVDVPVELSAKEADAYRQLRDEFRLELEGQEILTVANALVKVGRLRQCTNGLFTFIEDGESSKARVLSALLEPLAGEKVIIFSMYAQTIKYLQKLLRCKHVITGETSGRDDILEDWRKNGTLLLGTAALGTGLNLQDAHYIVQFDLPFTSAEEEQRIARSWRTGQKNPVTIYNLMAAETIDIGIRKLIEKKRLTMDELSKATEDMTDEDRAKLTITMADIKELI